MSKETIWSRLRGYGFNEFACAGIMANIQAESAYLANNAQDGFGWDDDDYTAVVDSGEYSKDRFCKDSIGYGLCQWTYWSRKSALYSLAKNRGVSIGDESMQLDHMYIELTTEYSSCYKKLVNATSAYDAAYYFCTEYERPADMESQGRYRGSIAETIYNEFAGSDYEVTESPPITYDTGGEEDAEELSSYHIVAYGDKTWYGNALQSLLKAHGYDIAVDKDVRTKTMDAFQDFADKYNLDIEDDFGQLVNLLFSE